MATKDFPGIIREDLQDYCPASNLAFNEKIKQRMAIGEKIFHFGFGQAPFPVIECFTEALRENAHQNAYLDVAGIPELRRAVCDFHERHDKFTHFTPYDIIIGPGTKELIFLVACVFSGDVIVVSPSWTTYKPQTQLAHHKPYIVKTNLENEWKITPEMLVKTVAGYQLKGTKLLIMCNPDNPTGTCYSNQELEKLTSTLRELNIIVLCDEIYSRLHYKADHHSLAKFYPEGTIVSSGFSKWASAGGWRLGYHMYPKELGNLKEAVKSAASHTYSCAPSPIQYAAMQGLLKINDVNDYIMHTTRIMREVALFCHRELTSVGVRATVPTAGYYIFPDFEVLKDGLARRNIKTCEEMCAVIFTEAKVALMAGGPAFLRPVDELTTRLCFVNFDGGKALQQSRALGLDASLPENFVEKFCSPVYEGIIVLKNWVKGQLDHNGIC